MIGGRDLCRNQFPRGCPHTTNFRKGLISIFAMALLSLGYVQPTQADVAFEKKSDSLTITIDGKPFATYVWADPKTTRPYFKQVYAPGGEVQITRNHPQQADDLQDHATFHPGIWWAFGDIGGNDYWRMKAKIVGGHFVEEPKGGKDSGTFTVRDRLLTNGSDQVFCEQLCRYRILQRPAGILIICDSTLRRDQGDFWLGDQEEMGLGVRLATPIATVSKKGGRILNSARSTDLNEIRTKQSDWCDYSGPIGGGFGGVMIMNNPSNFRKPWWHAVDTGLLVATPLAENELNGRGKKHENVLVKAGEPFTLSYGVLVHLDASPETFDPKRAYADFLHLVPTLAEKPKERTVSKADLPQVPDGFQVSIFAQEPMVYKPTSMCFDAKGRLFLGQGPQYPENYENSMTDSVYVLIDADEDGVAETAKQFAKGFNSVQGLAWRGNDLYVANSPELTVVRDLDGDDIADEYVVIFTDLGNREHALHGLNWAPDGKLYMSKGNSKGHNQPDKYGRVAPKPFRELWDVEHPAGAPDSYPPKTYTKDNYRKTFHHWDDDWGREGGVLRCDPLGANLEIVTRGLRNPWDMTMDPGFNWLATDNDQSQGDRFAMPFSGAHFGWGHPYAGHWSGDKNLPTVPVSGPMFPGSGTGIVYYDNEYLPPAYRQVFILNDWLDGTFVYRPTWDGALMQPQGGTLQPLIRRGTGEMLYRPTDLEYGPDGSLYICGWGGEYHYERNQEGSWIFRVTYGGDAKAKPTPLAQKRAEPLGKWTLEQLVEDLSASALPIWRVEAQEELIKRGASVRNDLITLIEAGRLSMSQQTWAIWALGRMAPGDPAIDEFLVRSASPTQRFSLNLRLQAIRVLADRVHEHRSQSLPKVVGDAIADTEPRVRFEAVQAIRRAEAKEYLPALIDRLADEPERLSYFAGWGTLRQLSPAENRKQLLKDARPKVRLAALLSLQENYELTLDEALAVAENDSDREVQSWAMTFAMNPRPKKMPNTTARVELEQTVPAKDLIERATKAADKPLMRQLYLKLMSRASFRSSDWQAISAFYKTLANDEERALVLVPLTASIRAKDDVWDAFAGAEPLQRAGVECWQRMVSLSARSKPSSERMLKEQGLIKEKNDPATNADANSGMLASWLLEKLAKTSPTDKRIASAAEVLATSSLPPEWKAPATMETTLAAILEKQNDSTIRSRILSFVGKLEPAQVSTPSKLRDAIKTLCVKPDPRLYLSLVSLTKKLEMNVEVPKLEVANKEAVLARLATANANRGRHLFFESIEGLGCAACHRIAGKGSDFAPDLSGIGLRVKPETIVESILTPSAAITEGYSQQQLVTDDGRTILGVILRETGAELTVFKPDRTIQTVPAASIVERQKLKLSIMPEGYNLFGNDQIADIAAYLMTLKHNTPVSNRQTNSPKGN